MEAKQIAALIGGIRANINRFLLEELKRYGITGLAPSHGAILFYLFANQTVTMKELAKAVRRDKSTVTTLVGKLVSNGYVQKENSTDDQRTINVCLTRKGKALKPAFDEISERLMEQIWRGIHEPEKKEVVRILNKIASNF
jgi:DNA-binding MarR family transcriptional regulator